MDAHSPVLLLSGLPLERKPSFLRQLDSLAAFWRRRGRTVFLGGPVFPDPQSQMRPNAWAGRAAPAPRWRLENLEREPLVMAELFSRTAAQALIVLGYPDQFPFLHIRLS